MRDGVGVAELRASALLRSGWNGTVWARFDAAWYLARHPDAAASLGARAEDAGAVLEYYIAEGAARRHAPNRFFDEAWYLAAYPEVARLVAAGAFQSGFDHYWRAGCGTLSGHFLFDEAFYRSRHPDLAEVLEAQDFRNGYDHYLKHGDREGRPGHLLFDPAFYRAAEPEAEADGALPHCLARFEAGGAEPRTSPHFDPVFYRARHAAALERGGWRWAIAHYLCNDTPTLFDPSPQFSETFYLARHPDIAAEVAAGRLRNGYWHFLADGMREGRAAQPRAGAASPVDHAAADHAVDHAVDHGADHGAADHGADHGAVAEAAGRSLFRARAAALLPLWGRAGLDFTTDAPALTVVMVLRDRFALTMMALASLRAGFAGGIELVLVDSGSTDETRAIGRYVRGARVLRFGGDIGRLRGRNAGLCSATTARVLFLDNDVELAPGAVAAALRRLDGDGGIGAVGGKVVRSHGRLQEAGGIVWRDGATAGYLRDASPLAPEANFARDVDFCSGVFLMVRTALLEALEGFDEALAPAGREDADLCVRIAARGQRVVYDPAVMVRRLGCGGASPGAVAPARIAQARAVFAAKHAAWLACRRAPGDALAARETVARRRVLLLEDRLPLRSLGSGFVRSNDIVASMAALGFGVTVFPVHPQAADLAAVYADFPDTVEVMHDRTLAELGAFLTERAGHYEAVWVARTHNLARVLPVLDGVPGPPPRLVLDTEAVVAVREAVRAGGVADEAALRREFAGAERCAALVAVNEAEAGLLRQAGLGPVHVLGHRRAPTPTATPWAERSGMLFLGAIHELHSPNHDALCWFVDEVLPLVEAELGWRTRLTVAGHLGAGVALDRFAGHPRIILRGEVRDAAPLYERHVAFVAPTRFAAGIPYKVHEAASFGLPVVATELLSRQLGWRDDEELLAAPASDARGFAERVLRLHRSEPVWHRLRTAALDRIAREHAPEGYETALLAILG